MNNRVSRWLAMVIKQKPRTVPFAEAGCILHKTHDPVPSTSELHHTFPVYLQARVWADVDPSKPATAHDKERVPVCGDGHTDTHRAIDAILAGRPVPKGVGITERALARQGVARFRAPR